MTSSFNMKGNAWRGVQDYIQEVVPGGMAAVAADISAPSRVFIAKVFLPSGWYDILPIEEITRVSARLTGETHADYCRKLADFMLSRDGTGIYRAILKFAAPELMVRALPFTTKRYFDFVRRETLAITATSFDASVSAVPQLVANTFLAISNVFITRAIENSGGKNVRCEVSPLEVHGAIDQQPIVRFVRRLSWTL